MFKKIGGLIDKAKEEASKVIDDVADATNNAKDQTIETATDAKDLATSTIDKAVTTADEAIPDSVKNAGSSLAGAVAETAAGFIVIAGDTAVLVGEIKDTLASGNPPTLKQVVQLAGYGMQLAQIVNITGIAEDVVKNMLKQEGIDI